MTRPLFEGVRFWVYDNVPMRDRWLGDITDNGGIVTKDINTADVRIADHVKRAGRGAPENSVSWKFIEQSVKNGVLEDVDAYRVSGNVRNPAAASRPSKRGRVPFTTADDQILANWLAKKELQGEAVAGNKIYQELAEICPHHTWQSWRARAVNFRGLLPKPRMDDPTPVPQRAPEPHPAPPSSRPNPAPAAPGGKVKFTKEDDELLLKYVEEAGKDKAGNKIYQALAEEYPHHSYHSWRDRYIRHLEPRLHAAAVAASDHKPSSSSSRQTVAQRAVPRNSLAESKKPGHAPSPVSKLAHSVPGNKAADHDTNITSTNDSKPGKASPIVQEKRTPSPRPMVPDSGNAAIPSSKEETSGRLSAEDIDLRLEKIKTARFIQRHGRGFLVRLALRELEHQLPRLQAHSRGVLLRSKLRDFFDEDLVRFQAHASGALVRMSLRLDESDAEDAEEGSAAGLEEQLAEEMTPRRPRDPKTPKEEFYVLLNEYLEATGAGIVPWPEVQGRTLELWDLWNTVRSLDQGRSPSLRNWEHIAETLGFDWIETPEATLQLKACYEASLGEFEELQRAFEAEDDGTQADQETQGSVAQSDAVMEQPSEQDLPSESLPFHSSPPRIQGQKRAFEPPAPSSSADLGFPTPKRMRYSKDFEIPSTPMPETRTAAPTAPNSGWTEKLSFGRRKAAVATDSPHHSTPGKLPRLQQPRPAHTMLEPETQDFGFEDDGFQSQPDLDPIPDTTPSQQLHLESEQITPVPFSGFKVPKSPYESPLGVHNNSTSSRRKVVRDSAAARPVGRSIISSIEDPTDNDVTPKAHAHPAPPPRSESPVEAKAKRRSLPASFYRAVSPPKGSPKTQPPTAPPRASLPTSIPDKGKKPTSLLPLLRPPQSNDHSPVGPSSAAANESRDTSRGAAAGRQTNSGSPPAPSAPATILPSGPTPPRGLSALETMDYYVSLGYKRRHVMEAFKATLTWGLAAVVMQELREGRGLPDNWEGVWTARDDADLKFVLEVEGRRRSGERALDRELRRAERLRRRLEVKHGAQRMRDREMSFRT